MAGCLVCLDRQSKGLLALIDKTMSSLSISTLFLSLGYSQELDDIRKSGSKIFRIETEEGNLLQWKGLIVPVSDTVPAV